MIIYENQISVYIRYPKSIKSFFFFHSRFLPHLTFFKFKFKFKFTTWLDRAQRLHVAF